MEQPEYNLFHRQKVESDFLPLYEKHGLGTTVWSPLASGLLSGKYNDTIPLDSRILQPGYEWLRARFESEEGRSKLARVKKLGAVAKEVDCSLAQLSLAWCLTRPFVSTVILGASKRAQLEENLKALGVVSRLTPSVLAEIDAIVETTPEMSKDFK